MKTWHDFLVEKTNQGNEQALSLLRYQEKKKIERSQDILSAGSGVESPKNSPVYQNFSHKILKNGTVVYDLLK